jgi:hypothetical protein
MTLAGFGVLGFLCFVCYHAGRSDQKSVFFRISREANDEAARTRDRLRSDPDYAGRVRNRFTR